MHLQSIRLMRTLRNTIILIVLALVAFIMLFPIAFLFNTALKTNLAFSRDPMSLVKFPQWHNFVDAWNTVNIGKYFFNSVFMCFAAAAICSIVSLLAAFPISRNHFRGAQGIYMFFLASMFFPGSLVATIALIKILNLYDTQFAVILLWALGGLAINVFMMTGFVKGVPRELDEAAFIDGCGYFRYILTFAMPLMKPIIATVFVLKFIGSWNDFVTPYLFLISDNLKPIASALYLFIGQYATNWPLMASSIIIVATPMIILYVFMQQFIIEGMTSGALKG